MLYLPHNIYLITMNAIAHVRLQSHQLHNPLFNTPKELVQWMGAVQAQEYNMAKWALGIRLPSATLADVERALREGEILRTHVMRPTWHFVASEDIRWMLRLTGERIKAANEQYAKSVNLEIGAKDFNRFYDLTLKVLEGGRSLTRDELGEALAHAGMPLDANRIRRCILCAEADGILCSGVDKGTKQTYALLEERAPAARELHRDEALALLASRYFKSHSPAGLNDFVWWSGLTMGDARKAIDFITPELIKEKTETQELYVHETYRDMPAPNNTLHLLPSYDEYLISYKERTTVLAAEHHAKAFNKWGIFYPVVAYKGKIAGNWKRPAKKGGEPTITWFDPNPKISNRLVQAAQQKYRAFHAGGHTK